MTVHVMATPDSPMTPLKRSYAKSSRVKRVAVTGALCLRSVKTPAGLVELAEYIVQLERRLEHMGYNGHLVDEFGSLERMAPRVKPAKRAAK